MVDYKTRRQLRMSLGSRTSRRVGTKSRKAKDKRPARPRARLSALILKAEAEKRVEGPVV